MCGLPGFSPNWTSRSFTTSCATGPAMNQTFNGHFKYSVMPCGLTKTPVTFQHIMNDIFRDILDRYVVISLCDILIFSDNPEQHCYHIHSILERLRKYTLFVKLDKYTFDQSSTGFLGYILPKRVLRGNSRRWMPSAAEQGPGPPESYSTS